MGRWIQSYDGTGKKGIFWRFYLMGIVGWFIVLLTCTHIKYYNVKKNNAKWLGAILGSLVGIVVYFLIVGVCCAIGFIKILIIFGVGAILFPVTLLIYKRTILEWEKEEKIEIESMSEDEILWDIYYQRYQK